MGFENAAWNTTELPPTPQVRAGVNKRRGHERRWKKERAIIIKTQARLTRRKARQTSPAVRWRCPRASAARQPPSRAAWRPSDPCDARLPRFRIPLDAFSGSATPFFLPLSYLWGVTCLHPSGLAARRRQRDAAQVRREAVVQLRVGLGASGSARRARRTWPGPVTLRRQNNGRRTRSVTLPEPARDTGNTDPRPAACLRTMGRRMAAPAPHVLAIKHSALHCHAAPPVGAARGGARSRKRTARKKVAIVAVDVDARIGLTRGIIPVFPIFLNSCPVWPAGFFLQGPAPALPRRRDARHARRRFPAAPQPRPALQGVGGRAAAGPHRHLTGEGQV